MPRSNGNKQRTRREQAAESTPAGWAERRRLFVGSKERSRSRSNMGRRSYTVEAQEHANKKSEQILPE